MLFAKKKKEKRKKKTRKFTTKETVLMFSETNLFHESAVAIT